MTLPTSLDLTSSSHSCASPLFSLPTIPYFFTITPYPLTCQSVQRSLSPSPHMKRRHSSTAPTQRNHNATSHGYTPVPSANDSPAYTTQPQTDDQGIEGRVLKRMRRIKLNSE
ncbi:hypothetical protein B0O80DRAFT_301929 [Mortierella sp. GBAus27b]|nr:hypothetical protein B0O80DRAFT_301929 [Mortierella sp. GBAus27b]